MHISHRVLTLTILLGLGRVGLAQTSSTSEDSLKGRIWTATARRAWADEKMTPPAIKWATGTDFSKWVLTQQNDKAELGSLWKAVRDQVGKDQPATPAQLAKAILIEINKRKTNKTGALAKVNMQSLQVDLEPFVPVGSTTSAIAQATDSATPAATQPAGASRTVTEDENPAPEGQLQPAPAYSVQPVEPRYFGLPPALAGAALALLGALLGIGLARQLQPRRRHRHHSSSTPLAEPETSSVMTSLEYRKLQTQNENLTKQLQQVKKQLAELQKQLPAAPTVATAPVAANAPAVAAHISATSLAAATAAAQAAETPPPVAAAPPAAEELSIEEMVGAQPAAPQPAATRYGPVQETPFVEERKIVDAPLPQLALMLTVNAKNPDQASFTLNPNVDQARLIGDGLTRLQKFFDYDPPLGGRIMLVTAAAPGQLQRHADGWQVVQRARLNIS